MTVKGIRSSSNLSPSNHGKSQLFFMFLIIWYKALYSFDQDSDSFLYLPLNASSTVKATLVAPAKTVIVHYERVEEDSDHLVHVDQTIFAGWISKEKFSYHRPTVQVTTLWHFQKSQVEERSGHQLNIKPLINILDC